MAVTQVQPKPVPPDTYFAWEFDGTEQSVDDLQVELDGTESNVIVEFVSSSEARSQNPAAGGGWNAIPVDDTCVFRRAGNGTSVVLEGSGDSTWFDLNWEPV